jgi:2-methylisocitrate lyase-like PEP mutase family enzyme
MASQSGKAKTFQDLHRAPGTFVIPNPWDAGTAKMLTQLGFKALATTSAGLAFSLGRPDGKGETKRAEILANAAAIVAATDLPVSADLEGGFGDAPEDAAATIKLAAKAGLVGGSIEDATGREATPIFDMGLAVDRVRAAVEAAHSQAFPFTLTARAENFLYGRADLADTIKRLQAFQEAGADVLYAPGLRTLEDIAAVVRSVDRPVNVVMGLSGSTLTVAQLAAVGVKRISVGSSLARAALGALHRAAEEIRDQGSFTYAADALSFAELNKMFTTPS